MRCAALRQRLQRYSVTATMLAMVFGSGLTVGAVTVDDTGAAQRVESGVRMRMLAAKPLPVDVRETKRLAVDAKLRERAAQREAALAVDAVWNELAECESDQRWDANTGNGYFGGLQFSLASWRAVGGAGHPHEAPKHVQVAHAERLLERQGWGAWPSCSRQLGLR